MEKLTKIIQEHPVYVPVMVAAEFVGVTPQCLRASIDQNRCPFGFSWRLGDRTGYKIPTIAFVSWLSKGVPLSQLYN